MVGSFPSAKNAAALPMRRKEKLSAEQSAYLERLGAADPAAVDARRSTQDFAQTVRNLEGEKLDGRLKRPRRPPSCGVSPQA